MATLESYVRANDDGSDAVDARFAAVEDISYTREGRKGIITGTRDAGAYFQLKQFEGTHRSPREQQLKGERPQR